LKAVETPQTGNYKKIERQYVSEYGKQPSREREAWRVEQDSHISNSAETHKYST